MTLVAALSRPRLHFALACALPFAALAVQYSLWDSIAPLTFLLFYPALVVSSWMGGRSAGAISLLLSVVLANWFFIDPVHSLHIDNPDQIARVLTFIAVGALVIYAHHRFQRDTERYRSATENINDVLWVADDSSRQLRYISPSVKRQRGYTPAELMAMPLDEALTPAIASQLRALSTSSCDRAAVVTTEAVKPCKDGSKIFTEVVMSRVRNRHTGRTEIHGVSRDITARKQAEVLLKEREQRMRRVLDNIPTAIACCSLGEDARLIFLNRQFVTLFGYGLDELPDAAAWAQLASPDETSRTHLMWPWEMATGCATDDGTSMREARVQARDGSIREVQVNAELLEDMVLVSLTDITERKAAESRLRHMAQHDALTDLPNRVLFDEHIGAALASARRDGTRFGLMFIDLDRFKTVNDTMGHRIGDLLLLDVSQRLRQAVRESDIPARIGGDEFVVLLRNVRHTRDAMRVAEKIRARIGSPYRIEEHQFSLSASVGIAIYPDHGTDAIELARNADAAMYRAKEGGRNAVVLFDPASIA